MAITDACLFSKHHGFRWYHAMSINVTNSGGTVSSVIVDDASSDGISEDRQSSGHEAAGSSGSQASVLAYNVHIYII